MIEFKKILKVYPGGARAVDDVSMQVPRGQFCVLLGPSGAGKSTLLRVINGMVEPDSGQVSVDGIQGGRATWKQIRPRVGMIHQQFHLSPRLSVLDNVLTGALPQVSTMAAMFRLFSVKLKRKACSLLGEVGLEPGQLYRRAMDLSGGQQQRVAIARALMLDPVVLLADEPVASLDPQTSVAILALLHDACRKRGVTVLCSLHQVDLASRYSDRIVAMRKGRIVFDGDAADLQTAQLSEIYGPQSPGQSSPGTPVAPKPAVRTPPNLAIATL